MKRNADGVQDEEEGGISDQPEDMADVFHTFFGIAGLSLMGFPGLEPIDPIFALPTKVVQQLKPTAAAAVPKSPGPTDQVSGPVP